MQRALPNRAGAGLCVIVVHKLYPQIGHVPYGVEVLSGGSPESDAVTAEAHRDLLAPVAGRLRQRGIDVDVRVVSGDPATGLLRVAEEAGADLLVVGDRAVRGVFGGVAAVAVRKATMPVLVTRTGQVRKSRSQPGLATNT